MKYTFWFRTESGSAHFRTNATRGKPPARHGIIGRLVACFLMLPLGQLLAASPSPLSNFQLNGNGIDEWGNSPPMNLAGVSFTTGALQLPATSNFTASGNVPNLSYESFTVSLDFNPCGFDYPHTTILSCGPAYRWLGIENDASGHLRITLNNSQYLFSFSNSISAGSWHTVVCSVDLTSQRILTFLDGQRLQDIALSGFQFEVVGTASEDPDKVFSFWNYGNATRLCGYAANLRVYSRALGAEEITELFSGANRDLYNVVVSATCASTNSFGRIVSAPFQNRQIIQKCAEEEGIKNLAGLSLVYDRSTDALEVVSKTNSAVICAPIAFAGDISVTNSAGTVRNRLALTLAEETRGANGTLRATENYVYDAGGRLIRFKLSGTMQFASAAGGTNGAKIYSGAISTGAKFTPNPR